MKTTTEIRLENFKKIAATFKTQRELSDALGESTGFINQLLHGRRGIGDKVARKFEEKLRLNRLSLDVDSIPIECDEIKNPVESIEVTPEELGIINLLRDLNSLQRQRILNSAKEFKKENAITFNELGKKYTSQLQIA